MEYHTMKLPFPYDGLRDINSYSLCGRSTVSTTMNHLFPNDTHHRNTLTHPEVAIKLLKRAAGRIERNADIFVCLAIKYSAQDAGDAAVYYELRSIINYHLDGCSTVDEWVRFDMRDFAMRKAYRMAWIDSMIATIESTGAL